MSCVDKRHEKSEYLETIRRLSIQDDGWCNPFPINGWTKKKNFLTNIHNLKIKLQVALHTTEYIVW